MRRPGLLTAAVLAAAAAMGAQAQQFDGHNLRYPEHALGQQAAPWAAGETVREQVEANATIKERLARHGVFLVPDPPHPPRYATKGTQMADLTPDKVKKGGGKEGRKEGAVWGLMWDHEQTINRSQDFGYQAGSDGGEGVNWCTAPGAAPRWTSEKGSVMMDGHPVWLKGINWCVLCVLHGGFEGGGWD